MSWMTEDEKSNVCQALPIMGSACFITCSTRSCETPSRPSVTPIRRSALGGSGAMDGS